MQLIVDQFNRLGEYSAEPDSAAWRQYRDMVYQINRKHKAMDEAAFLRLRDSVAVPVVVDEDDVSRCSDHSVVALPPILRLRLSAKHQRPPPPATTPGSDSGSGNGRTPLRCVGKLRSSTQRLLPQHPPQQPQQQQQQQLVGGSSSGSGSGGLAVARKSFKSAGAAV